MSREATVNCKLPEYFQGTSLHSRRQNFNRSQLGKSLGLCVKEKHSLSRFSDYPLLVEKAKMIFSIGRITHWPQWLAGVTVSLAVLVTGLANGWTSPYLAQLTAPDTTLPLKLTASEASWVASFLNLGRTLGAVLGAISQEWIGRKKTLLLGGLPLATGWICVTVASSVPWLYAARLLLGVASGMIWSGLSLYLGEIADPMIRGSLIFLNTNMTAIGAFLGNVMGPYASMETFSYVAITGTGIFITLFALVPDSPYHHIVNGKISKAEESLRWFKRDADVKREIQELQDFVGTTNVGLTKRLREMKKRVNRNNMIVLFCLNLFLYLAGHNTMSYYSEIIVAKSEVNFTPSTVVIALGFSTIVAGASATLIVDKFGRRSLLIASGIGAGIAQILLGSHFHMLSRGFDAAPIAWLPIFSLFLYNFSVAYGIVPVPNALVSELFPPILKTLASMFFSGSSAILSFATTKTFQPFLDVVGEKYVFWSFAISAIGSSVFTYFFVPETRGKSLFEIQESLRKGNEVSGNEVKKGHRKDEAVV